MDSLLTVDDLRVSFHLLDGHICAVDGVSFHLKQGEILSVLGESGCGKSVTALSIMGLVPPPGKINNGCIDFNGMELLSLSEQDMNRIRGNEISMIFQEPMTSLNPVFKVGNQISEAIKLHQGVSLAEATDKTIEMLKEVDIPSPERNYHQYPHQLSGGMRQRVMIAMALCCNPKLLIADEPTTALDVTIQAQILTLLQTAQQERDMSILLITHDLGVIAEIADRVIVMYAGMIVEEAESEFLFDKPLHPYTKGLLESRPSIGEKRDELSVIEGTVPHPSRFPEGCRFHPRCPFAKEICRQKNPRTFQPIPGRKARCWLFGDEVNG